MPGLLCRTAGSVIDEMLINFVGTCYINDPCRTFVNRLILNIHYCKRCINMSVRLSDEKGNRCKSVLQINTDESQDVLTSNTRDSTDHTVTNVTEDELAIHKVHREACDAKEQMYVDPFSRYKVFTEYAHLQRGSCCGTACRHCPYGQVNVKNRAMRKPFNSLYYV